MSNCVHPLIIAHRGASADYPENTRDAFVGAGIQGSDWVELDVRLASDGALIVNHDPWYHDLRMVWDTPSSERPVESLLLAEAIHICATYPEHPMGINVEIKGPSEDLDDNHDHYRNAIVERSLAAIDEVSRSISSSSVGASSSDVVRILISSFDREIVDLVRELGGPATSLLLLDDLSDAELLQVCEQGHTAVNPVERVVTPEFMKRCAGVGLSVNVWTVDDPQRLRELAEMCVDGVVTNVPAVARDAISTTWE